MTRSKINDGLAPIGDADILVAARQAKIAALAIGLVDQYGDDAILVAERHIEGTSGDTATTWESIVLHLRLPRST